MFPSTTVYGDCNAAAKPTNDTNLPKGYQRVDLKISPCFETAYHARDDHPIIPSPPQVSAEVPEAETSASNDSYHGDGHGHCSNDPGCSGFMMISRRRLEFHRKAFVRIKFVVGYMGNTGESSDNPVIVLIVGRMAHKRRAACHSSVALK